jgi:hypothetical protein
MHMGSWASIYYRQAAALTELELPKIWRVIAHRGPGDLDNPGMLLARRPTVTQITGCYFLLRQEWVQWACRLCVPAINFA